jgi:DNA-binding MarR family transcriptional regulator
MMTSQVVRALERDGLLRREIDDEDARIRRLRTTAKGRKLAVRSVEAIEGLDARVLMRFAESPELVDVLRRIAGRDEAGNPLD